MKKESKRPDCVIKVHFRKLAFALSLSETTAKSNFTMAGPETFNTKPRIILLERSDWHPHYDRTLANSWSIGHWSLPPSRNESSCETIQIKVTVFHLHVRFLAIWLIFKWNILHENCFWNRGKRQLEITCQFTCGIPSRPFSNSTCFSFLSDVG